MKTYTLTISDDEPPMVIPDPLVKIIKLRAKKNGETFQEALDAIFLHVFETTGLIATADAITKAQADGATDEEIKEFVNKTPLIAKARAADKYCEAEGLNQREYRRRTLDAILKKALHEYKTGKRDLT